MTDRAFIASTLDVAEALARARVAFREAGSPSPRLDAEVLLAHVMERDRAWLLAHPEEPVADLDSWERAVTRRTAGEPVAYIRGHKDWRSLRIRTDARALIPRPETELLADAAIAEIAERLTRDDAPVVAWEVATGSGAVAAALALRFRSALALGRLRLIASDLSPDALELAAENLAEHGVEALADLACADLLEPAGGSLPRPDVVVANLPYVATSEVDSGTGSFSHEPRLALDGGADGLDVVRRLLATAAERSAPMATLLLEVGAGQAEAVRVLAPRAASVSVQSDLSGVDRLVRIGLPNVSE